MLSFFRTKIFLLLILLAVAATFYYFGDTQKLLSTIIPKIKETSFAPLAEKLESITPQEVSKNFQDSVKNTETEIIELSKKTSEVSQHTENVLGSTITAPKSDNTTPIHEKALEYGKYIYCKQVVTDYEELNPSLKK